MRTFDEYWNDVKEMFGEAGRQTALHAWICARTSALEIKAAEYGLQNATHECPVCGEKCLHVDLEKAFKAGAHWQSDRMTTPSGQGHEGNEE